MDQFEGGGGGDAVGSMTKEAAGPEQSKTEVEQDVTGKIEKKDQVMDSPTAVEDKLDKAEVTTVEEQVCVAMVLKTGPETDDKEKKLLIESKEDSEATSELLSQPQPGPKQVSEDGPSVSEPCKVKMNAETSVEEKKSAEEEGTSREGAGTGPSADERKVVSKDAGGALEDKVDSSAANLGNASAGLIESKENVIPIVKEEVKAADPVTNLKPNASGQLQLEGALFPGFIEQQKKPEGGPGRETDEMKTVASNEKVEVAEIDSSTPSSLHDVDVSQVSVVKEEPMSESESPKEVQVTESAREKENPELKIAEAKGVVIVADTKMGTSQKEDANAQAKGDSPSPIKEHEAAVVEKLLNTKVKLNADNLLKAVLKRSAQQVLEHDLTMDNTEADRLKPADENVTETPQKKVKTDADDNLANAAEEVEPENLVAKLSSDEGHKYESTEVAGKDATLTVEDAEAKLVSTRLAADFSAGAAENEVQVQNAAASHSTGDVEKQKNSHNPPSSIEVGDASHAQTDVKVTKSLKINNDLETYTNLPEPVSDPADFDRFSAKQIGHSEDDQKIPVNNGSDGVTQDEWELLTPQRSVSSTSRSSGEFAEKFADHSHVNFSSFNKSAPDGSSNSGSANKPIRSLAGKSGTNDKAKKMKGEELEEWKKICHETKLDASEILWGLTSSTIETVQQGERWSPVQILKWMEKTLKAKVSYRITVLDGDDNSPAVKFYNFKQEDLRPTRYLVDVRIEFGLRGTHHNFLGKALSDSKVLAFNVASKFIVQKVTHLNFEKTRRVMPRVPSPNIPYVLRLKMKLFDDLVQEQCRHKDRFQVVDETEEMKGRTWHVCTISFVDNQGKRLNCKRCGLTKDLARISAANAAWEKLGLYDTSLGEYEHTDERFDPFRSIQSELNLPFVPLNLDSVQIPVTRDSTVRKEAKPVEHGYASEKQSSWRSSKTVTCAPRQPYGSDDGTSSWGARGATLDEEDWDAADSKKSDENLSSATNAYKEENWNEQRLPSGFKCIANNNMYDMQPQNINVASPFSVSRAVESDEWDDPTENSYPIRASDEVQPVLQHPHPSSVAPDQPDLSHVHFDDNHSSLAEAGVKALKLPEDNGGAVRVKKASEDSSPGASMFRDVSTDVSISTVEAVSPNHKTEWEAAKVSADLFTTQDESKELLVATSPNSPLALKGHDVSITIETEEEASFVSEIELKKADTSTLPTKSPVKDNAGPHSCGSSGTASPIQESTTPTLMQVAAQVTLLVNRNASGTAVCSGTANYKSGDLESFTPISLVVNADSDDVAVLSDCATMLEDVVDAAKVPECDNLNSNESIENLAESAYHPSLSLDLEEIEAMTVAGSSSAGQTLNTGFLEETRDRDSEEAKSGDLSPLENMPRQDCSFGTPNAQSSSLDLNPTVGGCKPAADTQDFSCQCDLGQIPTSSAVVSSSSLVSNTSFQSLEEIFLSFSNLAVGVLAEAKNCLEETRRLNQARNQ